MRPDLSNRAVWVALTLFIGVCLALPWIPAAGRAWLLLAALLGAAAWARGRLAPGGTASEPAPLVVHARQGLARDCGLALVEAEGHKFLLAWGPSGARFQSLSVGAKEGCSHG